MVTSTTKPAKDAAQVFVPREHGATAMLLTPFFSATILLRSWYWLEMIALVAVVCAFAIKDPLVVLARQRFVWTQEHAGTAAARRSALIEGSLLALCALTLVLVRGWRPFLALFVGAGAFTLLAVSMNVRNQQRSAWFQVASAVALSSTSLAASLAAEGDVPPWCWLLWFLCALQAAAGIFVVHSRLDARIGARPGQAASHRNRRAALVCQVVMVLAAGCFAIDSHPWNVVALLLASTGYLVELRRQRNPESLRMPLKRVGVQALTLSTIYALLNIAGLWRT